MRLDAERLEARVNRFVEWFLRNWIWVASGWAGLVVVGAVLTPILAANGFDTLSWMLYKAYRLLCPQREAHSWFISGHKMGFEQRDTAMFVAGAVGGPLYVLLRRFNPRISWKVMVLAQVPMLIDVGTQIVGLRDSDGFWRAWTGALGVFAFIAWMYPKLDADFREGLARLEGERQQQLHVVETPHLYVVSEPAEPPPRTDTH
jgi:uncharacterized membrane protein